MAEIVLAATTGLSVIGMVVLACLLQKQRQETALALEVNKAVTEGYEGMRDEFECKIAAYQHNNRELEERYRAEDRATEVRFKRVVAEHRDALEALRTEHTRLVEHLDSTAREAASAASVALSRYGTLIGGHEFHKGGKVAAHGEVSVLYNCVTCPPDANVRLLAPRGFFVEEAVEVASE